MHRYSRNSMIVLATFFATPWSAAQADVNASQILESMHVSPQEIAELEDGGVISFSDVAYESTKRELSADAVVLVDSDLTEVLETLYTNTTLIPIKVIIDDAEIDSDDDFANVRFEDAEYKEVENLFRAKAGKKFNFSESEYVMLRKHLDPYRKSDRAAKIAAASDAMRALLLNRYHRYKAEGLEGLEGYKRSERKQIDVGGELRLSTDTFEPFADDFPEFYKVMSNYPDGVDCCEHYFRWLNADHVVVHRVHWLSVGRGDRWVEGLASRHADRTNDRQVHEQFLIHLTLGEKYPHQLLAKARVAQLR